MHALSDNLDKIADGESTNLTRDGAHIEDRKADILGQDENIIFADNPQPDQTESESLSTPRGSK